MKIEWDTDKRDWTLRERGLDFADVALIDWDNAIRITDTRHDYGEERIVVLATLQTRLMVLTYTIRGDALRVISLRKANTRERKLYDTF